MARRIEAAPSRHVTPFREHGIEGHFPAGRVSRPRVLDFAAPLRSFTRMKAIIPLACLVLLIWPGQPAGAQDYDYRTLHLLRDSHTHVILRITEEPEDGDPPQRGRAACNAVQALDRRGRAIANGYSRMFQRYGIHLDNILTSEICRNVQAGIALQLGPVRANALLNPLPDGPEAERQTEALLGLIETLRPAENALLLTHESNIEALTGVTLAVGEGLVFRLEPFGEVEVRGRFTLPDR
jgi:phosphohistidine phosphatase SixA